MSIQVARSSSRVGSEAAASRRRKSAGTGAMKDLGEGPVSVMPYSRRIQRV